MSSIENKRLINIFRQHFEQNTLINILEAISKVNKEIERRKKENPDYAKKADCINLLEELSEVYTHLQKLNMTQYINPELEQQFKLALEIVRSIENP